MKTALATMTLLFAAFPVWAQCSLCRLAVEQDPSLGTAFNKAILLMMIPALAVFAGIFLIAHRSSPESRRDTRDETDKDTEVR